jgi:hypothetical protein
MKIVSATLGVKAFATSVRAGAPGRAWYLPRMEVV